MGSLLFSQSMINRLKVPLIIKGTIGFGYDNNSLRLSDKEIKEDDVSKYGITSTLDSPILRPKLKLIYSPIIMDRKITNIVTSISYSHFTQASQKSYLITNLSLEVKFSRSFTISSFVISCETASVGEIPDLSSIKFSISVPESSPIIVDNETG